MGSYAKHTSPWTLISIGMAMWTGSVLLTAASVQFPILVAARMVVGVGEAAFVALAAPMIGK